MWTVYSFFFVKILKIEVNKLFLDVTQAYDSILHNYSGYCGSTESRFWRNFKSTSDLKRIHNQFLKWVSFFFFINTV